MVIYLQTKTDMRQRESVLSVLRTLREGKKEYHQDGFYITNVTVGTTMMEFELSANPEIRIQSRRKIIS